MDTRICPTNTVLFGRGRWYRRSCLLDADVCYVTVLLAVVYTVLVVLYAFDGVLVSDVVSFDGVSGYGRRSCWLIYTVSILTRVIGELFDSADFGA